MEVVVGGAGALPGASGGKLSTTRRGAVVDDSGDVVPGLSGGKNPGPPRGRTGGITTFPICRDACSL